MSSNNPFAAALNEPNAYVHHRDPPPPPGTQTRTRTNTPPARPPKPSGLAPPSYEEAAGPEVSRSSEYPREKPASSTSSSSSRPPEHQSTRDASNRPPRRSRSESDKKTSSHRHRDRSDKDRERRHKKSPSKKAAQPVKSKNLDTIDKLDVTGFFGGGFHHDGPFDACTPHRNKNVKAAPVMAFPADGPNNSISGSKVNKHPHMNMAFGNYDESQNEIVGRAPGKVDVPYTKTNHSNNSDPTAALYLPKHNPSVVNFDANQKAVPVHGEVTPGLGSSTFVDGAPAPKAAAADEYLAPPNGGGLGRKKSLVQRLRKNSNSENNSRRGSNDSPEPRSYLTAEEEGSGNSLLKRVRSLKVGRK